MTIFLAHGHLQHVLSFWELDSHHEVDPTGRVQRVVSPIVDKTRPRPPQCESCVYLSPLPLPLTLSPCPNSHDPTLFTFSPSPSSLFPLPSSLSSPTSRLSSHLTFNFYLLPPNPLHGSASTHVDTNTRPSLLSLSWVFPVLMLRLTRTCIFSFLFFLSFVVVVVVLLLHMPPPHHAYVLVLSFMSFMSFMSFILTMIQHCTLC